MPSNPTPSEALREALEQIACFNDEGANRWLEKSGSWAGFDEPSSVQIARAALSRTDPVAEGEWQDISQRLFRAIEHGDEKHRDWLRSELDKFFAALSRTDPVAEGESQASVIAALKERCQADLQYKVAAQLGFSPTYISDVLNGKRNVSAELAQALGYQRRVTFTLSETPEQQP